mmetsp:Transcript_36941/g.61236  ORF Transcript_36941/g.61236 Transcript_36941/m.61236 type:complete len:255 (-) Transcript_36941:330-1094(-)
MLSHVWHRRTPRLHFRFYGLTSFTLQLVPCIASGLPNVLPCSSRSSVYNVRRCFPPSLSSSTRCGTTISTQKLASSSATPTSALVCSALVLVSQLCSALAPVPALLNGALAGVVCLGSPGLGHIKVLRVDKASRSHTAWHAARSNVSSLVDVASTARPAMRNCTFASSNHQQHSTGAPSGSAPRTCSTFSARLSVMNVRRQLSQFAGAAATLTRLLGKNPRKTTVRTDGQPVAGLTVASCSCLRFASDLSRLDR